MNHLTNALIESVNRDIAKITGIESIPFGPTPPKPFALYRHYSDGSGKPDMIYIGGDKAAAFDALMDFASREYFDSSNLKIDYSPEQKP